MAEHLQIKDVCLISEIEAQGIFRMFLFFSHSEPSRSHAIFLSLHPCSVVITCKGKFMKRLLLLISS